MKGFVIWCFLQKLINVKDVLHSLCPLDSIAERGMVQKTLCSSEFKATWINSGFNKQKMDEMVHCFSLHICLRLSAVQKNDKLHQTEPVIGSRVFFLIFHFKKVATKVFSIVSETLYQQKKKKVKKKILFVKQLKKSVMAIMNLQNISW